MKLHQDQKRDGRKIVDIKKMFDMKQNCLDKLKNEVFIVY